MKKIFNVMLMLVLFSAQALAKATTENTLSVWMDQKVELTADGKTVTRLTVYEYDPNINYLAFNMALSVPKGVKVYQRKEGRKYVNDITLNPDRTYDHTISCGMPNDFTIKIMGYSLTNSELFPDNEDGEIVKELFSIGLIADDTAINGTYKVEMWDVNFSILDEDKQHAKGYGIDHIEYSDFTITGGQDFPGIDYTMTSAGYGTLILPFNCEIPKGLTVLECNGVDNNNVLMLNSVNSFAANTPYIVKGTPATYHFNGVYSAIYDEYSTDYMTGVYVDKKVPVNSYVLQDQKEDGLAFYRVYDSPIITMPAYRCWLKKQGEEAANCMRLPGILTGVDAVEAGYNQKVDVYTTSGVKVRSNVSADKALDRLPAGVYVINNNKVIKK